MMRICNAEKLTPPALIVKLLTLLLFTAPQRNCRKQIYHFLGTTREGILRGTHNAKMQEGQKYQIQGVDKN